MNNNPSRYGKYLEYENGYALCTLFENIIWLSMVCSKVKLAYRSQAVDDIMVLC